MKPFIRSCARWGALRAKNVSRKMMTFNVLSSCFAISSLSVQTGRHASGLDAPSTPMLGVRRCLVKTLAFHVRLTFMSWHKQARKCASGRSEKETLEICEENECSRSRNKNYRARTLPRRLSFTFAFILIRRSGDSERRRPERVAPRIIHGSAADQRHSRPGEDSPQPHRRSPPP